MADAAHRLTERPTFVVGFARSGTSLLRSFVSSHPLIQISPETHFLSEWMPRFAQADLADRARFDEFWRAYTSDPRFASLEVAPERILERLAGASPLDFRSVFTAIMQAHSAHHGKQGWGEKTPAHYEHLDTLLAWYPEARIFFLVRDPRAVVTSWRELDAAWTDRPVHWIVQGWRRSADAATRWGSDARVLVVRYEDLVGEAETGRRIFEHLGVAYPGDEIRSRSGIGEPKGTYDPHGPIRGGGVDRWRRELSRPHVAAIEALASAQMQRHGYELVSGRVPRAIARVVVTTRRRSGRLRTRLARRWRAAAGVSAGDR